MNKMNNNNSKMKIHYKMLIAVVALSMFVSFLPASANTLPSPEKLQQDIKYVRWFMLWEYEVYINAVEVSGYSRWGFKVERDGLDSLHKIVDQAQVAFYRQKYEEVVNLLEKWEDEFDKYDAKVAIQLQDIDYRYLTKFLISSYLPSIDEWLLELKNTGYQIDEFITEWGNIKKDILIIKENWLSDPAKYQGELFGWEGEYFDWEKRIEGKINALDEESMEDWDKALREWLDIADAYFKAEVDSISPAVDEELVGAKEDLDFLESKRPLLEEAREALKNNDLATADAALNKLDEELFQYWSQLAKNTREYFDNLTDFASPLVTIEERIKNLKNKGIDVAELEDNLGITKDVINSAREAADSWCGTYLECGDGLYEYGKYQAITYYNEITAWMDWWDLQLSSYESNSDEQIPENPFIDRPVVSPPTRTR